MDYENYTNSFDNYDNEHEYEYEEEYDSGEKFPVTAICTIKLSPKLRVPKCCKSGEAIDTR